MIPMRLFPPVVRLRMTLRGASSFRNRPLIYIRPFLILIDCKKFSLAKLKTSSAAEEVTESCAAFPMERIKVLVISSVVPNARGSGGELVLHRHLNANPQIECEVVSWE